MSNLGTFTAELAYNNVQLGDYSILNAMLPLLIALGFLFLSVCLFGYSRSLIYGAKNKLTLTFSFFPYVLVLLPSLAVYFMILLFGINYYTMVFVQFFTGMIFLNFQGYMKTLSKKNKVWLSLGESFNVFKESVTYRKILECVIFYLILVYLFPVSYVSYLFYFLIREYALLSKPINYKRLFHR